MTANFTFAQSSPSHLWNKAFDFYLNKKQFDSSLFYYRQLNQQFPNVSPTYINNQIASCYLKSGDITTAESFYLRCLSLDRNLDSLGSFQTTACYALSNIYYNRKQFRDALTFLDYTKTKYRPLRRVCQGLHGGYESRLTFAYRKSQCYYGLNMKDSAISQLAPVIFRPREDVYLDSLLYEEMTQYFVNTVIEVYGRINARTELQKAINSVIYNPTYDDNRKIIMFSVDCFITFANTKINLDPGGACQVYKKGEVPSYFSKDTLVKEFMDSPAYNYIICNEGQPTTGDFLIYGLKNGNPIFSSLLNCCSG